MGGFIFGWMGQEEDEEEGSRGGLYEDEDEGWMYIVLYCVV